MNGNRMRKVLTLLLVAALVSIPEYAIASVSVSADVEPKTATIGDRIRYVITIRGDEGEKIDPAVRLLKPEPFEVVDVELSKERTPEVVVGVITFTLVPFETGNLKLPPYIYEWTGPAGETKSAVTGDVFLNVKTVLDEGGGEPGRDVIAGEAEPAPDWKEYIAPVLILVAVIALVLYLIRRWRRKRDEEALRKIILTPYELAIKELEGIEKEDLYSTGRVKVYFSSISDAVRRYIEGEFGTNAMELTTYELSRDFPSPLAVFSESVIRLLEECDSVKFAKAMPDRGEADEALKGAFGFVRASGARFGVSSDSETGTGRGAGSGQTTNSP
jgi:hypothetical protein